MSESDARESTGKLEAYGELSLLPKVGVRITRTRHRRIEQMLDSVMDEAGLDRGQLDTRIDEAADQVHDLVASAAVRAGEVDDAFYIDALGRLVAGALDSAQIDEVGFIVSEVVRLEPVHLRALLGFFWLGKAGNENADPDLSPAEADWAADRDRSISEIADLLKVTGGTAAQVLHRLDRDGFIYLRGGKDRDRVKTSRPRKWSGQVVATLFPNLEVNVREADEPVSVLATPPSGVSENLPASRLPSSSSAERDRRAIIELEKEIKRMERERHGPLGASSLGLYMGDSGWLAVCKRRLRRVDPDNPWAYDD